MLEGTFKCHLVQPFCNKQGQKRLLSVRMLSVVSLLLKNKLCYRDAAHMVVGCSVNHV